MNKQVEAVNALLLAGEPGNVTKPDTNGYVGYEPQSLIDAMNEVFDLGNWGFEELSTETVDNEKGTLAVAQMAVWIKGVEFKPFAWGQSRVTRGDTGDAKKGAQTDGIKKALAYFSIGNRAYHGLLDKKASQTGEKSHPSSTPTSNGKAVSRPSGDVVEASGEEVLQMIRTVKSLLNAHYQIPQIDQPAKWQNFKKQVLGLPVEDEGLSLSEVKRLRAVIDRKIEQAKGAA